MEETDLARRVRHAAAGLLRDRPGRRPTVGDVSKAMASHPVTLRRNLRDLRAQKPHALIMLARLGHVATLIQRGTKIDAARTLAGFRHKGNFNRQFRSVYRCLPREYRSQEERMGA